MPTYSAVRSLRHASAAIWLLGFGLAPAHANQEILPTGMSITPTAAQGSNFQALNPELPDRPDWQVDHAVDMVKSPDGKTALILTSGYNRINGADGERIDEDSNEYVFVYDIAHGNPIKTQVIGVPNTYNGIAWNPNGSEFYVSGGVDDNVHFYRIDGANWVEDGDPVPLGHSAGAGIGISPMAAGLAVDASGTHLLVANFENDSVSLVDLASRSVVQEFDLRPGKIDPAFSETPGGTYPLAVQFKGDDKAYVSSQRDREFVVLNVKGNQISLKHRIATQGQPNKMTISQDNSKLYVASDNEDAVLVVDTRKDQIVETIPTIAPQYVYNNRAGLKGVNPNNVALSPYENLLFVSNGGTNSVAVIRLAQPDGPMPYADKTANKHHPDRAHSDVIGLIPTGWYPSAVTTSNDGQMLYVINSKGNAGPNPDGCRDTTSTDSDALNGCKAANQYVWQLEKAGLLSLPMPNRKELNRLTWQVADNSNFPVRVPPHDALRHTVRFLRKKIKHVIYIVKENRTYDQILGDLQVGNGDPSLALLSPYVPNQRALATEFTLLDNFFDSGETSGVGWDWSTAAKTNDFTEKTQPVNYAGRGLSYDWEGANRNINVSLPTFAARKAENPDMPDDPETLPGTRDAAEPDSPAGEAGAGYLWDAALRAGLSIRNYGFFVGNLVDSNDLTDEQLANPFANHIIQVTPLKQALAPYTDRYFRGYDQNNSDTHLFREWEREFDHYVARGELPNLSFVRFPHDHFGNFDTAKFGVNTVETQVADNDYAVGLLIDKIAHSPFKDNTLVFVIEDDAQNGGDHVDPHRSTAFIAGPYVKHGAVISTHYTTVSFLHTMGKILGLEALNLNDGFADFMDVFDLNQKQWDYQASVPEILYTTSLPLPDPKTAKVASAPTQCFNRPARSAGYWQAHMAGQNFAVEDKLDVAALNHALWVGLKGDSVPYPERRDGKDLSHNRAALLARYRADLQQACNAALASR